jgi:type III pantothenate kinase
MILDDASPWIGLSIGNSRLHWFYYQGMHLDQTWDTPHILPEFLSSSPTDWREWQQHSPAFAYHSLPQMPELWILSVVPSQTLFWQRYPYTRVLTVADIPLQIPYATFGLDRALAIWAAGTLYQWPVLVIDAGTALTYTGAISTTQCLGGAILPGLGLQLRSLHQFTAALPSIPFSEKIPPRWALDTPSAIHSGILNTLISGLTDFMQAWLQKYPTSALVMTGGDAVTLHHFLTCEPEILSPAPMDCLVLDPLLQGRGFQQLYALG